MATDLKENNKQENRTKGAGFTHLHVHSHYSLLDGLSKIDDLVSCAKELGMESVALTDHGVMYGAIEFYKKANAAGIKPIIGCEIYLANHTRHDKRSGIDDKRHHLVLLVKNNEGYKNLLKIVSLAHLEGFYYKPRADKELLKKYSGGLIALSACVAGEIPHAITARRFEDAEKLALEYQEIFGKGNYYFELEPHHNIEGQDFVNQELIKLSKKLDIPIVAANDSHYLRKEDAEAQDILLAVQTQNILDDADRLTMKMDDFSLKSFDEMAAEFKDVPEAIKNSQVIADACDLKIELGKIQLPHFDVPEGYTAQSYLIELCGKGLKKRYNIDDIENPKTESDKSILTRMNFELSVIEKMGYASYFLIVQDFVNWAKSNGIVVGPGRGSAAGSIVAYLTGITNIDPIKYELLFERFLNPDRISMPDIDLDFADTRRQEVLNYVSQKYGQDRVAQVITFGTMAARAAIRDAGRAINYTYEFCDQLAKLVPLATDLKETLRIVPEFKEQYDKDPQAKKLIDSAMKLEGVVRHASTHACGVVITKDPLTESIPLQNATQNGKSIVISQYEMHAIEDLGLLKMDFLGLKNLTIIENALNLIEKNHGVKINIDELSDGDLNDKKTYKLFKDGKTTGVFQFESDGMKRYLKELKPNEFEDLIAMVALYRPGPMELIPSFINRKHKKEKVEYLYPKLEPIMKNTYGIAVYQEQIMEMAKKIAGFTPGQADTLRKAIGKKIHKLLIEQQGVFMEGCIKNGVPKAIAQKLSDLLEPFSRYGFNRSHAACYALIAYQTAYLKANYQNEFMSALLTAEIGDVERTAFLIDECKMLGIDVLPPDINESFETFNTTGPNTIRFGLAAVKNVGENIVRAIIETRDKEARPNASPTESFWRGSSGRSKFISIEDFINKVRHKDLNKKSLESLVKCGAIDSLGERKQLLESMDILLGYSKEIQKNAASGQDSLFGGLLAENPSVVPAIKLKNVLPAGKDEKLSWEKELLGLYVSDHPLNEHKEYLAKVSVPLNKLSEQPRSKEIIAGGLVLESKKIQTKNNDSMLFVKIEDLSGKSEVIVFPTVYKETAHIWQPGNVILTKGKVSDKDGQYKIICNKAKILTSNPSAVPATPQEV